MASSPAKLSRRERQQQTREDLIRSASALFARHGFDGTSIQSIAQDAGLTRGAFYANFANKHEILDAALAERDAADRQRLTDQLDDELVSREAMAEAIAESQRTDLPLAPLRLEVIRQSLHSDELADRLRRNQRAEVEGVRTLLERVSGRLPLRDGMTATVAAQLVSAFLDGIAVHALVDDALDISALWSALVVALTESTDDDDSASS